MLSRVKLHHLLSVVVCSGCSVLGGLANRARPSSPDKAAEKPTDKADASPQAHVATTAQPAQPPLPVLPDDGITNATHQKFVGQIVFATQPIADAAPDETKLVSEFYADEWIYGRAYLTTSIENVAVFEDRSTKPLRTETRGYRFQVYVDGAAVKSDLGPRSVPEDRRRSTTQQIWPHPAPTEVTPRGWVELINGLSPGDHVVRLELWAQDKWRRGRDAIAAGELTLHKPAGVVIGTGKTFADFKRGMTDASLESALVARAKEYAKKQGWKETVTAIAIESPAWIDVPHKLGYIMARRLQTQTLATWPDGTCTAQAMLFEQKVERGKVSGPIYVGNTGAQALLDCTANTAKVADRWEGRARKKPTPTGQRDAIAIAPTPAPVSTPAPAPSVTTSSTPSTAPAPRVASAPPSTDIEVTAQGHATDARPGRFAIGVGMAVNAIEVTGVASYANLGLHLGRVQIGVGATWPFNALGYARFAIVGGAFELAPMISASVMAEDMAPTEVAISGGLSLAYALRTGPVFTGVRIDALVSYNPEPAKFALPILGSTYVRF